MSKKSMKIISKYVNFVILHVANIIICMLLVYDLQKYWLMGFTLD